MAITSKMSASAAQAQSPGDPDTTVDRYFAAIRAKDIDALMALYAPDAAFILPSGKSCTGKDEICALHRSVFDAGAPFPNPGIRFVGTAGIAVEIETRLADGSVRQTTNHYRFDPSGKILSLGVYSRG